MGYSQRCCWLSDQVIVGSRGGGFGRVAGGAVHFGCDGMTRQEFASAFGVLLPFPIGLPFAVWSLVDPNPTSRAPTLRDATIALGLAGVRHLILWHPRRSGGRVRRREFITLLGGAAVGWPLAASAQMQPKIPRVGYVFASTTTSVEHVEWFRQALRELGYVEGQTIVLEVRSAEARLERMPELVAELVGLKVDVLVAVGSPAALAAKNATQTIPIVIISADPI